jgi:copper oxidase (laccase) domain-containing protein
MDDVTIVVSNVQDGSMSASVNEQEKIKNRQNFLAQHQIRLEQSVLSRLIYEGDNYCRYVEVDKYFVGDGMNRESSIICDAMFTLERHVALFLPLADCIGACLYDQENKVLGLAHLGRHNLVQDGGRKTIEYMEKRFDSSVSNITVFLSPSVGKNSYPMRDFDGKSLQEVAVEQLMGAGVSRNNITIDKRDTATEKELFSHSEFLKGNQDIDGRHAMVVMRRE